MITLWKCNQEQTVVQDEVRARYRQQHAPVIPPTEKVADKADGPHHRNGRRYGPLIHGEQPLEDLTPSDGYNHGGDNTEEGVLTFAPSAPIVKKWCSQTIKRQYGNTDGRPKPARHSRTDAYARRSLRFRRIPRRPAESECTLPDGPSPNQVDAHHHVAAHIVA